MQKGFKKHFWAIPVISEAIWVNLYSFEPSVKDAVKDFLDYFSHEKPQTGGSKADDFMPKFVSLLRRSMSSGWGKELPPFIDLFHL